MYVDKAGMMNRWWALALLCFIGSIYGLFFSSGNFANPRVLPFPHLDKAGHALLFAAQFYCLAQAYLKGGRRLPLRGLLVAALLWAVSSEVLQALFTTQRHGDIWDAVADVCGALIALRLATRGTAAKPIRAAKLP